MQPITPIDEGKSNHHMQYDRSVATAFRNLSFGGTLSQTGTMQADNISGFWWVGTSATTMTIPNIIGRIPYGFLVMSKSGPCDVHEVSATDTTIVLGADTTGVDLKIFILG